MAGTLLLLIVLQSYKNSHQEQSRIEESAVVLAMFNANFHQVVSGSQNGSIMLWDINSSDSISKFHNSHGDCELTAMCFDRSKRRLITGSRDGIIKMWNFNNGQILRKMIKESDAEVSDIIYIEMVGNCLLRNLLRAQTNTSYLLDGTEKYTCSLMIQMILNVFQLGY